MARKAAAEQKRQDALIARAGSRGSGAAAAGLISVPNAAALALVPAVGRPEGTIAYVVTYGSYFALSPTAPASPDVVITASDGRAWTRDVTARPAVFQTQAAWFVDAAAGNNQADGKTLATPVKTKSEIVRRWGTLTPTIDGMLVVITYLSADNVGPDQGTDPWLARPNFVNGGRLTHTAALPATSFTGTLLAVTPKNIATGQALASTFTTTTGAIAADLLLINATRANSYAYANRDAGGGNWILSQPLAAPNGGFTPVEVDTWANGDAISGYVPLPIDLAIIGGELASLDASFDPTHVVRTLTIIDAGPDFGVAPVDLESTSQFLIEQCVLRRSSTISRIGISSNIIGCVLNGFFSPAAAQGVSLAAGIVRTDSGGNPGLLNGVFVQNPIIATDAIIRNVVQANAGPPGNSPRIYVDAGFTLAAQGRCAFVGAIAQVWGPGTFNSQEVVDYDQTAATQFPVANLRLNGVATGYSNVTAAGVVTTHGGIALTAANLDAAAGAAGFGGYAFGGGASFSRSGLQP